LIKTHMRCVWRPKWPKAPFQGVSPTTRPPLNGGPPPQRPFKNPNQGGPKKKISPGPKRANWPLLKTPQKRGG